MGAHSVSLLFEASLRHAFPLEPHWIAALLPPGLPGAYMLLNGSRPIYVGRSDRCLRQRLITHPHQEKVSHAVWQVCSGAEQAFMLEAALFHRFKGRPGLLNKVHPARPSSRRRSCPFCADGDRMALKRVLGCQS